MKMYIFILIAVLVCLSSLSTASADVINPGEKEVKLYYQITNINNYQDYIFLLHGNPSPSLLLLNSSEFSFYKFSTATIYAAPKSDFNISELNNLNSTEQDNFIENNAKLIPSNLTLEGTYGMVNQASTLEKVVVELEITSLNQSALQITKTRAKYYYLDGSTRTVNFTDQNVTAPPDTSLNAVDILWYFLLPLIAVVALLLLIMRRRTN
jgi:hypothetical protein